MKKYLLTFFVSAILTELVLPQGSCCGGMGGTGTRFGLGTANAKELQLQIAYDLNFMNAVYDGDGIIKDDGRQRVIHSGILEANYGISRKISIAGIISYTGQEIGSISPGGIKQVEYISGIGDMIIMAKLGITNPLAYNGWGLYVGFGSKLPTGSFNQTRSDGSLYFMDLQPGTGSFDAISWISLSKSHIFLTNLYLSSGATFRLSGKNRNFRDSLTYMAGNEFQYTGGFSYNFYRGIVFDVFSYFRYRFQAMDKLSGIPIDNCGGHWLFFSPGIKVSFTPKLSLLAFNDFPLYQNINGPQLTTTYRASVGLTYNFGPRHSNSIKPDLF